MGHSHSGSPDNKPKRARVNHGPCSVCGQEIRPGDMYEIKGGSRVVQQSKAHKGCRWSSWENRQAYMERIRAREASIAADERGGK